MTAYISINYLYFVPVVKNFSFSFGENKWRTKDEVAVIKTRKLTVFENHVLKK